MNVSLIDGHTHQGWLTRADEDALELHHPVTMPATAKLLLVTQIVDSIGPA